MTPTDLLILAFTGLIAGILAGILGIGGGTILVPLLVALGYSPVHSVATSSFSILITAISGSVQNWRMGMFSFQRVIGIGLPAVVSAQIGADLASRVYPYYLLAGFGIVLILNIYLIQFRKRLIARKKQDTSIIIDNQVISTLPNKTNNLNRISVLIIEYIEYAFKNILFNLIFARIMIGSLAGILAGFFGVGGGVIMVPLQILLLRETIKTAIQTSLGAIVITSVSACLGHALRNNVVWITGFVLGFGGIIGAQVSTRFLPRLPDEILSLLFRIFLAILSVYVFWLAWQSYTQHLPA